MFSLLLCMFFWKRQLFVYIFGKENHKLDLHIFEEKTAACLHFLKKQNDSSRFWKIDVCLFTFLKKCVYHLDPLVQAGHGLRAENKR